jgi:hypothetical protein
MDTGDTAAALAAFSGTWFFVSGAPSRCSASPCALLQISVSARMSLSESSPFQHEAAQGVALPPWAILGPFEYFLQDRHGGNTPKLLTKRAFIYRIPLNQLQLLGSLVAAHEVQVAGYGVTHTRADP